ncbi:MAG: MFS transporter [Bacteroidales bacterium]|nr:MFS transporter [Bacteroidales bacterium]
MNIKLRLIVMNFLQFAIWGAYLTSMGRYLGPAGMGAHIGLFYSVQGIVSLFMHALMGIVDDRWVSAQKMLALCHGLAGMGMLAACYYAQTAGDAVQFAPLFALYTLSVAFFMPTLALSNSVAYNALERSGLDTVRAFPPIRVFGTVGFICSMWLVDLAGFQASPMQFAVSGALGLLLALYALSLPPCAVSVRTGVHQSWIDTLGLRAFVLFKDRRMAVFFVFSMLLGMSLQITNGFANPFISSFAAEPAYADTFGVQHANILISLSQISETLCILLIPFFLRRFGIKRVMLVAMLAWVLRFGLFGMGNPGPGVWCFVLSMVVYGLAFDFFNISGSLFVDKETDPSIRSSAQGLFVLMTNGFGATIGTLVAQQVVNRFCQWQSVGGQDLLLGNWGAVWYIFAAYALVVAIAFALMFKERRGA